MKPIERHQLHPDEQNPVFIETSGEFDEYVLLSYDASASLLDSEQATVILSPAEANRLIIELEAWLHR